MKAREWMGRIGVVSKADDRLDTAISTARPHRKLFETNAMLSKELLPLIPRLFEAAEFCLIYQAFNVDVTSDALRGKLVRALEGPKDALIESPKNSAGRNTMFELALAAEWKLQGRTITLGEPDLLLESKDTRFFVECKRPFTEHGVRASIKDAAEQVGMLLDDAGEHRSFGIIAISLSRVLNPGDKVCAALPAAEKSVVERTMGELRLRNKNWKAVKFHPRIAALLFHGSLPGISIGRMNRVTVAQFVPAGRDDLGYARLRECFPTAAVEPPTNY